MTNHSLGSLPMWARRHIAELEVLVQDSERLHSEEIHRLRIEVITEKGKREIAELKCSYAERDLDRTRRALSSMCDAVRGVSGIDEPPEGMDPREWMR